MRCSLCRWTAATPCAAGISSATAACGLGFHRLAIMGLNEKGMQPFELDGSCVVCNGELYGFRPIRERLKAHYEFKSESDCEILLPLYREYGVGMFKMLSGQFSLILFDRVSGQFIAARDSSGGRPLYYGFTDTGETVFASEPESLTGLCARVLPFPPGHYYKDGRFVRYDDNVDVA